MKLVKLCTLALVSLVFLCSTSSATEIVPATLESMTEVSDAIVVGNVAGQYSYWEGQKIYTSVVVTVTDSLKSTGEENPDMVELKMLGGQVGDIRLEIDHAPQFVNEEKVMLFLKGRDHSYIPYGYYYGVYRVRYDQSQQKEVLSGPLFERDHSTVYNLRTMKQTVNQETTGEQGFTDFVGRVRNLVGQ